MRYLLVAFMVGFLLGQDGIVEPPEYPDGMTCTPAGDMVGGKVVAPDHPCHCKNMGDPKESCEKPTTNDSACNQWCHEKHCSCPLMCDMTQHVAGSWWDSVLGWLGLK